MKRLFRMTVAGTMLLAAAGCTTTERGAAVGAGTGAVIGAVTTGNVKGAAVGGAIGAVAGALIGRSMSPGYCIYRDRNGRRYEARC
jgi:hypothetical protein